jgi:hypothetical protein
MYKIYDLFRLLLGACDRWGYEKPPQFEKKFLANRESVVYYRYSKRLELAA